MSKKCPSKNYLPTARKTLIGLPHIFATLAWLLFCLSPSAATQPKNDGLEDTDLIGLIHASFSVDPNGAATYSLPFELPPGTSSMQPHLQSAYGSRQGNGILGMGMELNGISKIERCSATIAQDGFPCGVNYDDNDRFCLDGERLVNIAVAPTSGGECHIEPTQDLYYDPSGGNITYHTERESWKRVVADTEQCGNGPCSFTVTNKAGWTFEYGSPDDDSDSAGARVIAYNAATGDELGVRRWWLNQVTDSHGNSVSFTYTRDPLGGTDSYPCPVESDDGIDRDDTASSSVSTVGSDSATAEDAYICRIDYTANEDQSLKARRHVLFGYENRGDDVSDVMVSAQGGELIETSARLTSVESQVADENGNLTTASTYQLTYDDTAGRATQRSRLVTINRCGTDGTCFAQGTTLGYDDYPESIELAQSATTTAEGICDSLSLEWDDFDGDGRVDWLCAEEDSEIVLVQLSQGSGFDDVGSISAGQACSGDEAEVSWGDFDGDGNDDWLCYSPLTTAGSASVSLSNGTALNPLDSAATESSCLDAWMWTDFNGDGLTDWVCWQTDAAAVSVYVLLSDGTQLSAPTGAESDGSVFSGSVSDACTDDGVSWVDFDGDGLNDLICNDLSTGEVWVLRSTGQSLASVTASDSTALDNQLSSCQTAPIWTDLNGDGLYDWTCGNSDGNGTLTALLSTGTDLVSATSAANGKVSTSFTCIDDEQTLLWLDFNGDQMDDWTCSESNGEVQVLLTAFQTEGDDTSLALALPSGTGGSLIDNFSCDESSLQLGDFDGDGLAEWLCADVGDSSVDLAVYSSNLTYPDLITTITNGFSGEIQITYEPLTDDDIYSEGQDPDEDIDGSPRKLNPLTNRVYPMKDVQSSMYAVSVVEQTWSQGDPSYDYEYTYGYSAAAVALDGRGWLGFAEVTRTDSQLQSQTVTAYEQTFPFNGQITGHTVTGCGASTVDLGCQDSAADSAAALPTDSLCDQTVLSVAETTYYCEDFEDGETCDDDTIFMPYTGVYQVLPSTVRHDTYDYGTYVFSVGTTTGFDAYGNPTLRSDLGYVSQSWDGTSADDNLYSADDVYTVTSFYNQMDTSTDGTWLLGYKTETSVCSSVTSDACDSDAILQRSQINYDYADKDDGNGCAPDDWSYSGTMGVICKQRVLDEPGTSSDSDATCAASDTWIQTTFTRDTYGNATAIADSEGKSTSITFDTVYQTFPEVFTSPEDDSGNKLEVEKTYDALFGKQLTETDQNGNVFAWCLDVMGRLTAHQGPVPSAQNADINADDCPSGSSTTSPGDLVNLSTLTWGNDPTNGPYHQVSRRNDWAGTDDPQITLTYRDGMDRTWRRELDGSSSDTPIYVDSVYFDPSRISTRTLPYYQDDTAYDITSCYDSAGRRTSRTEPYQASSTAEVTTTTTTWAYSGDACDNGLDCSSCGTSGYTAYPAILVTETQAEGSSDAWQKIYRREVFASHPKLAALSFVNNGTETCFDHDELGRMTGVTDPIGAVTTTQLNSLNAPIQIDDPDRGTWLACYDDEGRKASTTDALGQTQTLTYDALHRTAKKVFKDDSGSSAETHTFTWDQEDGDQEDSAIGGKSLAEAQANLTDSDGSNLKGHLAQVNVEDANDSKNDSTYDFTYDAYGHVTSRALDFGGETYTTQFESDPFGRVTTHTYPDDSTWVSQWSAQGFLSSETLTDASTQTAAALTYTSYTALGRPGTIDYGSGASSTFTYDPLGHLNTRQLVSGNNTLLDDSWTWNPLRSLTAYDSSVDQTFGYSNTSAELSGAPQPVGDEATTMSRRLLSFDGSPIYAYDDGGNITTVDDVIYEYNNDTHQIADATSGSSFAAKYDDNGDTSSRTDASGTEWTFGFNTRHRLVSAVGGSVDTTYTYDFAGRRLQKATTSETVIYASAHYLVVGSGTEKYIGGHGGKRAAIIHDGAGHLSVSYFHLDPRSSVVLATDDSGAQTAAVVYDPWGNVDTEHSTDADSLRYSFNSKELDSDTGFYFFEARYYDPVTTRFLSPDTQLGGRAHQQDAWNAYAFVLNDPATFSDPTGHSWFTNAWHEVEKASGLKAEDAAAKWIYHEATHTTAGKIITSGVIDAAEIGAGLAIGAMTFGGSSVLSSTLISAGGMGLAYTGSHLNSSFSWKGYGIAQAEGAVSGLLTGGIGAAGGAIAGEGASVTTKIGIAALQGATSYTSKKLVKNAFMGRSAFHNYTFKGLALSTISEVATLGWEMVGPGGKVANKGLSLAAGKTDGAGSFFFGLVRGSGAFLSLMSEAD